MTGGTFHPKRPSFRGNLSSPTRGAQGAPVKLRTPIIFDMKSETVAMQRKAVKLLHNMLEISFPDRPSNLTTLRVFVPPPDLLEMFGNTGHWAPWLRIKLVAIVTVSRWIWHSHDIYIRKRIRP